MTYLESIPQVWDDDRDGNFFRIAAQIFSCEFCYGATVLLASYDPDGEQFSATVVEPVDHTAEITPVTTISTLRSSS